MCSLRDFPPLPDGTEIPLCIIEGKIQYTPSDFANVHVYTSSISLLPFINISREALLHIPTKEDPNRVFLPVSNTFFRRIQNTWYEKGAFATLEVIASSREKNLLTLVAKQVLSIFNFSTQFVRHIPGINNRESGESLVVKVSQNSDYVNNNIRCLAWHPHCIKIAVGTSDDLIRVYSQNPQLVPLLKCKHQRFISSLSWRPFSTSELALGCEAGILIWTIDPNSVITRPSPTNTLLLTRPNHKFVTSISWSPMGDLLISASPCDNTMYVWDVALEVPVPLRRVLGRGISFVTYSPNSLKVFAATTNIVFRVWETMKWNPDLWSVASGHVVSACWSPCGSVLLFATSTESIVYALTWGHVSSVFSSEEKRAAIPAIDVCAIELEGGERVGGEICSLVWDSKGRHLAIMFKQCNIIAVFYTNISTGLHISPCCFVKGMPEESPAYICFQDSFEEGANLTIGWSNGRIQYFPIVYTELPTYVRKTVQGNSFNLSPAIANITESSRFMSYTSN
uniref:Aladin seven-bladed propeller domain-containing protein n=2 Tax=Clastoptera arizonana TaxID=38151 RepID=A0A1B6C7V6_9HEMI